MRIFKTLLTLFLWALSMAAAAQQGSAELKAVLDKLKKIQTYGYELESNAIFPDGSKQKLNMVLYMDKPHKRLFYSNDEQLLLLTEQWAFQAYHNTKKASVFNVKKYNQKYKNYLPEAQAVFSSDITSLYLDSLVLKHGKVKSYKKTGNLGTFELSFPDNIMIKSMIIVINNATGIPESIRIKSYMPTVQGAYNKSAQGTSMETVCHNYKNVVPDSVFDPTKYFQVKGGKAYLLQYKNYKLTSLL